MSPKHEMITVRPGQVWEDGDPRAEGRRIRVLAVHTDIDAFAPRYREPFAVVELVKNSRNVSSRAIGRKTRIALRRFRPRSNGYELVSDAPPEATPGNPAEEV